MWGKMGNAPHGWNGVITGKRRREGPFLPESGNHTHRRRFSAGGDRVEGHGHLESRGIRTGARK